MDDTELYADLNVDDPDQQEAKTLNLDDETTRYLELKFENEIYVSSDPSPSPTPTPTPTTDALISIDKDGKVTGTLDSLSSGSSASSKGAIQSSFYSLGVSPTSVSSKTTTQLDSYVFYKCSSLTSVDLPACIHVGKGAFYQCKSLKTITLPKVTVLEGDNTSWRNGGCFEASGLVSASFPVCAKVGDYAFNSCTQLTSIDLPACTSVGTSAFNSCTQLTSIDLPACTSVGTSAFQSCTQLTSIDLPACTSVGTSAFYSCTQLTSIDLPACTSVGTSAFSSCYSLKAVILRNTNKVVPLSNTNTFLKCYHILGTVDATYNPEGLKDGYIYVPDELVDSYKTAGNWSTYAEQIKPLSELPTT